MTKIGEFQRIKNKHYREFLDNGVMTFLTEEHIEKALNNVTEKYKSEGRALIIALYLTGARPNEVLRLFAKDISKEGSYIKVQIKGSKGGLPRPIHLRYSNKLAKELYAYSRGLFPDMYLFYNYRSSYTRTYILKGKDTRGQVKQIVDISDKLRYYFKKWFKGVLEEAIPPYYLRHNRFSRIAEKGATDDFIMFLKGSKSVESIRPYKHMSTHAAKKVAKLID